MKEKLTKAQKQAAALDDMNFRWYLEHQCPDYRFDNTFFTVQKKFKDIESRLRYTDNLTRFILLPEYDEIKDKLKQANVVLYQNLDKFFAVCKFVGIDQVHIGRSEFVSLQHRYRGHVAMWLVVDACRAEGFRGCCGNNNQYQVDNIDKFLPGEFIGKAWDVETKMEVDAIPFRRYMVVGK